jgi:signal transduction protein with GAF and PtsI domain
MVQTPSPDNNENGKNLSLQNGHTNILSEHFRDTSNLDLKNTAFPLNHRHTGFATGTVFVLPESKIPTASENTDSKSILANQEKLQNACVRFREKLQAVIKSQNGVHTAHSMRSFLNNIEKSITQNIQAGLDFDYATYKVTELDITKQLVESIVEDNFETIRILADYKSIGKALRNNTQIPDGDIILVCNGQVDLGDIINLDVNRIKGIIGNYGEASHLAGHIQAFNIPTAGIGVEPSLISSIQSNQGKKAHLICKDSSAILIVTEEPILTSKEESLATTHNFAEHQNTLDHNLPDISQDNLKIGINFDEFTKEAIELLIRENAIIGLVRTEVLLDRILSGNDKKIDGTVFYRQQEIYEEILSKSNQPITFRVLDFSSKDKLGLFQHVAEDPQLKEKLIVDQIKKMIQASEKVGRGFNLLFPMINNASELSNYISLYHSALREIKTSQTHKINIGIQIETIEGVNNLDGLLRNFSGVVDFVAIGTSDLSSDCSGLKDRASASPNYFSPLLFRNLVSIKNSIDKANGDRTTLGKPSLDLNVCGALSQLPDYLPILTALEVSLISVPANSENFKAHAKLLSLIEPESTKVLLNLLKIAQTDNEIKRFIDVFFNNLSTPSLSPI